MNHADAEKLSTDDCRLDVACVGVCAALFELNKLHEFFKQLT